MSGGQFDYKQYVLNDIADQIEQLVETNKLRQWPYTEKAIEEFEYAIYLLRRTSVYVQRIDWLVSGDDGEETFHKRLIEDLNNLQS